jgi:hypothetical protein
MTNQHLHFRLEGCVHRSMQAWAFQIRRIVKQAFMDSPHIHLEQDCRLIRCDFEIECFANVFVDKTELRRSEQYRGCHADQHEVS